MTVDARDRNLSQEKVGLAVEAHDKDDDAPPMSGRDQGRVRRNLTTLESSSIYGATGKVTDAQKPAGSPRMTSDSLLTEHLSSQDSQLREPRQESGILRRPRANELVRRGGQHPNVGSGPVMQARTAPGSAEKATESQDVEQNGQVKGEQVPALLGGRD